MPPNKKAPKTIPQINTPLTPLRKGEKKITDNHPKKQLLEKYI
jgi:hypothetical protein